MAYQFFARNHFRAAEAFVDLAQVQAMGQQLADRQAAGAEEGDHARHVALGNGRADIGAFQGPFLGDQSKRRKAHALVRMGQARGHGRAPARSRGISKLKRRRGERLKIMARPDGFEPPTLGFEDMARPSRFSY